MIKLCSFALILTLLIAGSGFSQDINRAQLQQITKIQPAHATYLLPPQGQPAAAQPSSPQTSSGTSHKKRNIIIAVVAGAIVAGVIVAASNSSGSGY